MEQKIIITAIGLLVGWVVSNVAAGILESVGVPKHTATVAGGVIGALA